MNLQNSIAGSWLYSIRTRQLILFFVWLVVALLAAVHLPVPLTGDQALYMYGAKSLDQGHALYLDFWDIKQPGVYLFYMFAGKVFSFSEIGLHTMEALWFGAAAWFAYRIGKSAAPDSLWVTFIPLLTAGSYFVAVKDWHMTQPDGLLATPLAAAFWLLCDKTALWKRWHRLFLCGFATSIAAAFKIGIIIVPIAALIVCWIFARRAGETRSGKQLATDMALWLAGLLVPACIMGVWFAAHDALPQFLWTTFFYPVHALTEISHHPAKLILAVTWFTRMMIFWLPAGLIGAVWSVRKFVKGDRVGLPGVLMIAWLLSGVLSLFVQYHYWWPFHFNQFFIPLGVLAGLGVAVTLNNLQPMFASRAVTAVLVGILFTSLVAAAVFGMRATEKLSILKNALANPAGVKSAYIDRFSSNSARIAESIKHALEDSDTESIYVFGDPRVLLESGRRQAVAQNGWALEVMTRAQWQVFSANLRAAKPEHIYVGHQYLHMLPELAPELMTWLDQNYTMFHTDTLAGNWYQLKPAH